MMSKSRIFLYFCLSFVGGIFINSIIFVSQLAILGLLILGILLISVLWRYKKLVVIGFCLLFLVFGIWRHQLAIFEIVYPEEKEVSFIGLVVKEPDIRVNHIKLTIESEEIKGKILLLVPRYPEYQYGDKLKITGKLEKPPVFEDFNYRDFLAKEGVYSVIYWPEIELLGREKYPGLSGAIYAQILEFKNKLRESIYQNLSPPESSILGAMILGDRRKMSEELKEELNTTGLRHITAISGMHVTIISIILMQILLGLGFWRHQAFYLTLTLLTLFIIMVGLPPSAVRAGIMGGIFLLAQYLGKTSASSRAIIIAATLMLVQNPLLLRLDVGFQLSFLATMGIIYLGPVFQSWLKRVPDNLLSFIKLRSILAMTLSAQIFTLPILIYNFGYMSLIAPLTNVLVLPFLPFIIGLGFLFGLVGIIFPFLGWILSWPAWLLLNYLTEIVDWFSQLPLAALTIENLHWLFLVISYLILGLLTWRLNKLNKKELEGSAIERYL